MDYKDWSPDGILKRPEGWLYEQQIREKLDRLYLARTAEMWEADQKLGYMAGEADLSGRGPESVIIRGPGEEQPLGIRYLMLAHLNLHFDQIVLEISPKVLELPGAVINTAGNYQNLAKDRVLEAYYKASWMPANNFFEYLERHVNRLPRKEWFFGQNDEDLKKFLEEAYQERKNSGKMDKFKIYWSLFPEIYVPGRITMDYVIKARYPIPKI